MITMTGSAAHSSGITRVEWTTSTGRQGTATGTDNWSVGELQVDAGSTHITVTATSRDGNTASTSLDVSFAGATTQLDTTPPSLTITTPGSTSYQTVLSNITMRGTSRDDKSVSEVTWSSSIGGTGSCQGTESWVCADIPLLVGNNTITIRAKDSSGNVGWRAVSISRR